MRQDFVLEWLGGAAEKRFRRVRPEDASLPWDTLRPSDYDARAVEGARAWWTELAANEVAAVVQFSSVLSALACAQAPLDLVGMTSQFLSDECAHVELGARAAMALGGAAPRTVDFQQAVASPPSDLTPLQWANERVLRVSCVAEVLAEAAAARTFVACTEPLPRALYTSILRDEVYHKQLGALYIEWAYEDWSDEERARLGRVVADELAKFRGLWSVPLAPVGPTVDEHRLGFLKRGELGQVALDAALRDVVKPLAEIGVTIDDEAFARAFGPDVTRPT
ncbi:MAG: hypothetical protein JNL38_16285 [Myxococcales bacterium]|nr:hypothetical protein [Myxococcales bacterium]